jgi:hypothetical protein
MRGFVVVSGHAVVLYTLDEGCAVYELKCAVRYKEVEVQRTPRGIRV